MSRFDEMRERAIAEARSADSLILRRSPAVEPTRKGRTLETLDEQEREALRSEMMGERLADYSSSLVDDDDSDRDDSEGIEWDEPRMAWHAFSGSERTFVHRYFPVHQRGLGVDEPSPISREQAERYLPRLMDLHGQLSTIADYRMREDATRGLFIIRCAVVATLGYDPIADRQREAKRERDKAYARKRDEDPSVRARRQERDASPERRAAEALRKRAQRAKIRETMES